MHILFTRFPLESALGGAEIQTLSLMEGLKERGHTIEFAGSCPILLAECRKRNIQTTELHIGNPPVTKWGAMSFMWRQRYVKKKLQEMIESFGMNESYGNKKLQAARTNGYELRETNDQTYSKLVTRHSQLDAIVMLSLGEKLLLTDIAANAGINIFWVEHDRIGRWLIKNPWLGLLRKQSKKVTTIVVSELSKKLYLAMGWDEERVVAIGNGIELREHTAASYEKASQLAARSSQLRIGCIARLSYEKGVDVLIKAMAKVPGNITLEIIGTGREESSLKKLAHTLQLNDRITFTPHEKNIADAYARWDAFVLPSRDHDPFGMVAAEAMFAGIPVIVTNQCGIADYLGDGKDAVIVKADSSTALATGIMSVQKVEGRRQLRENGRKTAQEKFSIETMVKRYEDVFTGKSHS